MSSQPALVFAIDAYRALQQSLCALPGFEAGRLEFKRFPDGERYQRILDEVRERDVVLVGGTVSDAAALQLFDLGYTLVQLGCRRLTLAMPYYGYSTMERAALPGEVVTAKTRAQLISAIPRAARGTRVFLLDLHSEGIPHYFGASVTAIHLHADPILARAARSLGGDDFVLASTDAGRAKAVQNLAKQIGVDAAFTYKKRVDGSTTEVLAVSGDVAGKQVVIYDDMIRTGGSLVGAAEAYRAAGATAVSALATHGILPNGSFAKVMASGLIDTVCCTDSHPRARELEPQGLSVVSIASVFEQALQA